MIKTKIKDVYYRVYKWLFLRTIYIYCSDGHRIKLKYKSRTQAVNAWNVVTHIMKNKHKEVLHIKKGKKGGHEIGYEGREVYVNIDSIASIERNKS